MCKCPECQWADQEAKRGTFVAIRLEVKSGARVEDMAGPHKKRKTIPRIDGRIRKIKINRQSKRLVRHGAGTSTE